MQYLFGMHPVVEAVKAGKKFDKVLLKQGLEGVQFRELLELLKENEIPFQFVPGERLNRLDRGGHSVFVGVWFLDVSGSQNYNKLS